jgi:glycosyltransferase involved in cell wall biosynthesis
LVVSSGDSDALAKALLGLLGDAERSRELGLRGRSRYETYYNWETIWRLIRTEVRLGLNESSRRTETG